MRRGGDSVWVRSTEVSREKLQTTPLELSAAEANVVMRIARFALVACHELRTPLTSTLASLGMLQERKDHPCHRERQGLPFHRGASAASPRAAAARQSVTAVTIYESMERVATICTPRTVSRTSPWRTGTLTLIW